MKMKKKGKVRFREIELFSLLGLLVVHLALQWYFKYHNQHLSFDEFRLSYPGNIVNLIVVLTIAFEIIALRFIKGTSYTTVFKRGIVVCFVSICILLLARALSLHYFEFPKEYWFGQPAKKVSIICLYLVSLGLQLFSISYLWFKLFRVENRFFIRGFFQTVLLFVLILSIVGLFDVREPRVGKGAGKYEVGVVLGAAVWSHNKPSPILITRVHKAIELYKSGAIANIQLTGSNAPGEISEADAAFKYIIDYTEIPLNNVWLEKQTTSTTEQIRYIKNSLMMDHELQRICVITDTYHMNRVDQIAKFYNLDITMIGASIHLSPEKKAAYHFRESFGLLVFWLFGL
jgi:vancomycin permeability regulator SanA